MSNQTLIHNELKLSKDQILAALRIMMLARRTDEKHLMVLKQGKSFFHIGCSGHEAIQVAIGLAMNPEKDWAWTYYRDLALTYTFGHTPNDHFLGAYAKADDPASGGRQMPCHHGNRRVHLPTQSSPTGTQFLNAVGTALAAKKDGSNDVTYVASGEGTWSQREVYEAVNWASREKLGMIFCVQDNGYAISVPSTSQTAGGRAGNLFRSHPNLNVVFVDGCDFFESYKVALQCIERARNGKGPSLIHANVVRLLAHSSSDDQRKYRDLNELEEEKHRDPIEKLKKYILENKIAEQNEIDALYEDVVKEIDIAADWALTRADPTADTSTRYNYSEFRLPDSDFEKTIPNGEKIVMVDAINHAMHEEMKFNDKLLIFGEDVADKKGGVFTATKGLSNEFSEDRVFNSPLAEASIIGVALGLATRGYKPCVEIQFGDYIWPAFMQLKNEVATLRYRSNNGFKCPMVVRVAVGGYINGGLYHSQNIEAFFAHIPGLIVVYPSNAADAKGLLKTACRIDDPVIFCEHKDLYRSSYAASPEPDENYLLDFGKGKIVQEGSDITIVTYGAMVRESLKASKKLKDELNTSIEIIDLRTILPWDKELVFNSVNKTTRVLIAYEDTITIGFVAEIGAAIAKECFTFLDAPVERVAAKDSHIPYAKVLELDVLPTESKIYDSIKNVLTF